MRKYIEVHDVEVTYIWEGETDIKVVKERDKSTIKFIELSDLLSGNPSTDDEWLEVHKEVYRAIERDQQRNIYDYEDAGFGWIIERY